MPKRPTLTVDAVPSPEPFDADAWIGAYVRLVLELDVAVTALPAPGTPERSQKESQGGPPRGGCRGGPPLP